jgi:hypothetical protein
MQVELGLLFKVVWNVVLMAHITGMRSSCWVDTVARYFRLLDGCVQGYHWLEGFLQWSVWIEFHMIEEVLEIWRRQILSHCHVNNQPVRGWQQSQTWLRERVTVMLSLFCNATISMKCVFRSMIVSA